MTSTADCQFQLVCFAVEDCFGNIVRGGWEDDDALMVKLAFGIDLPFPQGYA